MIRTGCIFRDSGVVMRIARVLFLGRELGAEDRERVVEMLRNDSVLHAELVLAILNSPWIRSVFDARHKLAVAEVVGVDVAVIVYDAERLVRGDYVAEWLGCNTVRLASGGVRVADVVYLSGAEYYEVDEIEAIIDRMNSYEVVE